MNSLGAVTQTAGITTPNLLLLGSGAKTLTSTANNITNFAANVGTATINLVDNKAAFNISSINGTDGVTAGTFQLGNSQSTGQTNAINVTNLLLSSTNGTYTLVRALPAARRTMSARWRRASAAAARSTSTTGPTT